MCKVQSEAAVGFRAQQLAFSSQRSALSDALHFQCVTRHSERSPGTEVPGVEGRTLPSPAGRHHFALLTFYFALPSIPARAICDFTAMRCSTGRVAKDASSAA